MDDYGKLLNQGGEQIIELLSAWGVQVVGALGVLIAGWWISSRIGYATRRALTRAGLEATLIPFFGNLAYYLALAVTLIAVLNLFGVETTSLIAVLGAGTVAIGLALQGTLSSFAAGVMLLIFRPFKVKDFVDVGGVSGSVVEITLFTTLLHTPDNVAIVVPNSQVYGKVIRNFSANSTRRIDLTVGIAYSDDIGVAFDTIRKILDGEERVLADPPIFVGVADLADSSVNILLRAWCASGDFFALKTDLLRKLKEELEAAGCSFPFPQQDVYVHEAEKA